MLLKGTLLILNDLRHIFRNDIVSRELPIGGTMDYPIWELAMGGGMLMVIVVIPHVIVSHIAIGGGLLIVVTEALAVKRNDPELRELAKRSSLVLILVSTVFGAISGVGIWVVAGSDIPLQAGRTRRNLKSSWVR